MCINGGTGLHSDDWGDMQTRICALRCRQFAKDIPGDYFVTGQTGMPIDGAWKIIQASIAFDAENVQARIKG
ncbi:MAG: hypothetical protein HRT36_07865 [Alphaproteobacteria bacterium]|nr:hypothetical protein [Alphaproteobacteria bacterium]